MRTLYAPEEGQPKVTAAQDVPQAPAFSARSRASLRSQGLVPEHTRTIVAPAQEPQVPLEPLPKFTVAPGVQVPFPPERHPHERNGPETGVGQALKLAVVPVTSLVITTRLPSEIHA